MVFESDDPNVGWNGRVNNVGRETPSDVYVYKLIYTGPRGGPVIEDGFATLVR